MPEAKKERAMEREEAEFRAERKKSGVRLGFSMGESDLVGSLGSEEDGVEEEVLRTKQGRTRGGRGMRSAEAMARRVKKARME